MPAVDMMRKLTHLNLKVKLRMHCPRVNAPARECPSENMYAEAVIKTPYIVFLSRIPMHILSTVILPCCVFSLFSTTSTLLKVHHHGIGACSVSGFLPGSGNIPSAGNS